MYSLQLLRAITSVHHYIMTRVTIDMPPVVYWWNYNLRMRTAANHRGGGCTQDAMAGSNDNESRAAQRCAALSITEHQWCISSMETTVIVTNVDEHRKHRTLQKLVRAQHVPFLITAEQSRPTVPRGP